MSESLPAIEQCLLKDQFKIRRIKRKIQQQKRTKRPYDKLLAQIDKTLIQSSAARAAKEQSLPTPEYDSSLPIVERADDIKELIANHQVVVVAGETGSGKTTQLPKLCLELGRGRAGVIGHTQPRRIAARSVAQRIADELKQPLGHAVGYQVRFTDETTDNTAIKLMTDGILLAEMQKDRMLSRYDTIIIDEAHERSLNIDFLLGYLKTILPRRPDLKVIITSATIDLQRFSEHFDNAPIIEVSGRTYPVEIEYQPLVDGGEDDEDLSLYDGIAGAVERLMERERRGELPERDGDILIFLPGEREIRETEKRLKFLNARNTEIIPLYARLSASEQNKVFSAHRGRRIVLSTNVAETSLTVPGIRYVIDPGLARLSRYSYRSKVQRLPIEAISQASANQRAGRCGRVSEGVCIRLYSEEDFLGRPAFTDAEILRSNLSSVILQMTNLGLGDIQNFPFVDPPDNRLINDGKQRLEEIGALTKAGLTPLGKKLARLPIDPHLARMLASAVELNCLREILIIVSAMASQDPRERPANKQQAADEKHQQWRDEQSDFLAYVNMWDGLAGWRDTLSQNQFRKTCKQNYLSFVRLREWQDVHTQLMNVVRDEKWTVNKAAGEYESIHRALASGLLSNLGMKDSKEEYLGARNRRFRIFPGSSQRKKKPRWLLSGMLLETSQLFAHSVAMIEPEWVLELADHITKKQVYEPHYSVKQARVVGYQKTTLYGLVLRDKERVPLADSNPEVAHEIFVRECLAAEAYKGSGKFIQRNRSLRKRLEALEAKARRRDIVADDEAVVAFYQQRVPEHISDLKSFESWREEAERTNAKVLVMSEHHLSTRRADLDEAQFPDELVIEGASFPLSYRFDPGHAADGVSIRVPLGWLDKLPEGQLEWLVPGFLKDKCVSLVKGLPKQLRRNFVPVPDYVDRVLAKVKMQPRALTEVLAEELYFLTQVKISDDDWNREVIDDFYRFNIRVIDERRKVLAEGRDLQQLKARLKDRIRAVVDEAQKSQIDDRIYEKWEFGGLERSITVAKSGVKVTAYSAVVDQGEAVKIQYFDSQHDANLKGLRGLCRLSLLQVPQHVKYLKKELFRDNRVKLALATVGSRDQLIDDLLMSVARDLFDWGTWPENEADFNARVESYSAHFVARCIELEKTVENILKQYASLREQLRKAKSLALTFAVGDIKDQWRRLLQPGFIWSTPSIWLDQFPRYIQACERRLDQVQGKVGRDRQGIEAIRSFLEPIDVLIERDGDIIWALNANLVEFRYQLEELRVQLFAQPMKTRIAVSEKRLTAVWKQLQDEIVLP